MWRKEAGLCKRGVCCRCCELTTALHVSRRSIIQSAKGGGLRSPVDQFDDLMLRRKLGRNAAGNYYRYQQKLWPYAEALERELTRLHHSSVERTPLALLPKRAPPQNQFICEGRGTSALLEAEEERQKADEVAGGEHPGALTVPEPDDDAMMADLLAASQGINNKIMTDGDVEGTVLASARERARELVQADLASNAVVGGGSPSAKDPAGASWAALGLDPLLSAAVTDLYGPVPTRLQTRLLPSLLNEDHSDIVLNGVTGSGKTSALLMAMLQGVRQESAGMNVFIASSTITAIRAHDTLMALARRAGGGRVLDRKADDESWLYLGTHREEYEAYYTHLRRSLRAPNGSGGCRVFVTTADVMCELLFEKKMEFKDFGYLRRLYVDDIGSQIPMLSDRASIDDVRERLRNPLAAELLLGTVHQLPGPHIRSLLQLGLVSADMDTKLKDHLKSLCLKLSAHQIIMSPVRLPSTVHCLFNFFLPSQDKYTHVAKLIWNARHTIPGKCVIFIHSDEDMLQTRRELRSHGINAKMFSEVYADGEFKDKWKFLLLKESEAFGVDLPQVSHVLITFAPSSWSSFLHMSGRTGRLGNVGWVYTVTDKRDSPHVRTLAEELAVDFCNHVIDENLAQVNPVDVNRFTKAPELYGLDPQYAVQQHYEMQSESPESAYTEREFYSKPVIKQFQFEDYTPVEEQQTSLDNARKLAYDIERDPSLATKLQQKGLLRPDMKPTKKLRKLLKMKSPKNSPSSL